MQGQDQRNQAVEQAYMSTTPVIAMTSAELEEVVRAAVRSELSLVGLRLDNRDHQDEARKDLVFVRKFRLSAEGATSKVGAAVLVAMVTGLVWLFWSGATALLGRGN